MVWRSGMWKGGGRRKGCVEWRWYVFMEALYLSRCHHIPQVKTRQVYKSTLKEMQLFRLKKELYLAPTCLSKKTAERKWKIPGNTSVPQLRLSFISQAQTNMNETEIWESRALGWTRKWTNCIKSRHILYSVVWSFWQNTSFLILLLRDQLLCTCSSFLHGKQTKSLEIQSLLKWKLK